MTGVVGHMHDLHRKREAGSAFRQIDVAGKYHGVNATMEVTRSASAP